MDAICIPGQLPATVTRPRPLIEAVMAQSLREQGPGSRTAAAWRWVLTGHGPAPVSDTPGTGNPPGLDEITAEARSDPSDECSWPPWRHAFDPDPDRQQARRVLRWLTGAADAIPLLDLDRGRYVGARLYFARTDDELRQVRGWAQHGIAPAWRPARRHPPVASRAALAVAHVMVRRRLAPRRHRLPGLDTRRHPRSPRSPVSPSPSHPARTRTRASSLASARMYGVGAGRYDIDEEIHDHAQAGARGRDTKARNLPTLTGTRRRSGARQSSRPTTGRPVRTASRPPTITAAEPTTPAPATAAATAKQPDTASAASAPPAPTASATQDGPHS